MLLAYTSLMFLHTCYSLCVLHYIIYDCANNHQQRQEAHVSHSITIPPEYGPFLIALKAKSVPLHATKALRRRGDIAPTHSPPRH
jgi:hypothetical protein